MRMPRFGAHMSVAGGLPRAVERGVVLHPGCYTQGSEADGLRLIADALNDLLRARRKGKTTVLLEHTAGQGTALGATFEQLATIIAHMHDHPRVGVCLDTCHLLASGYDVCSPEGYAHTFSQFGRTVGFDRLKLFRSEERRVGKECRSRWSP